MTIATPSAGYPWLRTRGLRLIFSSLLTILEQGRIIHAQQLLIRQLYRDSVELTSRKLRLNQQAHH